MYWPIERHHELPSTNAHAIERVRSALATGKEIPANLVIIADRQTAGRGQHGRSWQSPPGGLYLSAIVTNIPPNLRDRLALFTGVAVAAALQTLLPPPHTLALRWPNDITLHHKKVAGILCESVAMGEKWASIIGIGINVNTELSTLPEDLRPRAASLHEFTNTKIHIQKVELALLIALANTLEDLTQNGPATTITRAQQLDELSGRLLTFHSNDQTLTAPAAGISNTGDLLLQLSPNAPPTPFSTGTILAIDNEPLRP